MTITDREEGKRVLAFDLIDVLSILDSEIGDSQWRLKSVEAIGPKADELHRVADEGTPISGDALGSLIAGIEQTIDGTFEAYRPGSESPWLRVRAVDAAAFDVESNDHKVLEKMRRAFRNVTDIPT